LEGDIQQRSRELLIQICDSEDVKILKGVVSSVWRIYYYKVFLGYSDDLNIREKQTSIPLSQNLV
jgi:hypothetical protein